jgi:hypothetical protein
MSNKQAWWDKKRAEMGDEAFRKWNADRRKSCRRRIREEFIAEYGGRCVCCGESEPKFLCLDHVDGDGAKHRKELSPNRGTRGGAATALLEDLKRRGWPKDKYQLLCYNCNNAKAHYGTCPHQLSTAIWTAF